MSEIPTPVSESTAIEIVRAEGSARSKKCVSTLTAGQLVLNNGSGYIEIVGTTLQKVVAGVVIHDVVSGNRVTSIKGKVRAFWDGAGTLTEGAAIIASTNNSGWFEQGTPVSGTGLGHAIQAGGASNSGTLRAIELL